MTSGSETTLSRTAAHRSRTCGLDPRIRVGGLHFDRFDNLFVQIQGRKLVVIAEPGQARHLYPFPNWVQKCSIDFDAPDLLRFPLARNAKLMRAVLEPGDMLFLPKLWWHRLKSLDRSISVNHWFGRSASVAEQFRLAQYAGVASTARVAWDFVWLGMLVRMPACCTLSLQRANACWSSPSGGDFRRSEH